MNITNYQQLAESEINNKTKPLGALGQLENIAIQLASIQQTLKPEVYPARVLVFGGDHGVTQHGVSAFPSVVTAQMMANFSSGGAAINVIANSVGASITVIDVGVSADLSQLKNVSHNKINSGTADFTKAPAMSLDQCNEALVVGAEHASIAHNDGIKTLALGEMGIGNTTSAAALICAFTNHSVAEIVGRGTGVDDEVLNHKCKVVEQTLNKHLASLGDPIQTLSSFGGFEIVAITGAILKAYEHEMIVIVDGFISTAAAIVACQINPDVRANLIFSHQSTERGHKLALNFLEAEPILKLGLRLGEGTGAALAIPIVNAAANILSDMATFEQTGISGKK